jgi:hypothetical protein
MSCLNKNYEEEQVSESQFFNHFLNPLQQDSIGQLVPHDRPAKKQQQLH